MIASILAFFSSGKMALIVAAIVAGLGFIWRVFAAGKNAEKAKVNKERLDAVKDKKQKDDEIQSLAPADLDKRFDRWVRK